MLQNAYLLAEIGADTAENERDFAEILPKIVNYPTGPEAAARTAVLTAELSKPSTVGVRVCRDQNIDSWSCGRKGYKD